MVNWKVPVLDNYEYQRPIADKDLTSPPVGPSKGDRYIIKTTGSGDWTGKSNYIAEYNGSTWDFITPTEGMNVWVSDENLFYYYTGAAWTTLYIRGTFTNADLAAGILTITHNKNLDAPYTVMVFVVKNTGAKFSPDYVCSANSVAVDLTLWGAITGTWGYILI